jgi:hypothetical protein
MAYTAADIEILTTGVVDRKVAENWHNRGLWLTPTISPERGKPRLYSTAHLFEALTRAALVEAGFTHASARTVIENRLVEAALEQERKQGRRGGPHEAVYVLKEEVAEAIYSLPELSQPKADWYWAILFEDNSNIGRPTFTAACKGNLAISKVCSRVTTVVHISAIVRDVLSYVKKAQVTS